MRRSLIILISVVALIMFASPIVIISANPQLASDIADNIVRPLIGDTAVIYFEKIFFNTSDTIKRITYHGTLPISAISQRDVSDINNANTRLNLTPLPTPANMPTLEGEGIWKKVILDQFPNEEPVATTFIRPDSDRPYALVTIIQMDMQRLSLGIVAGIKEPGGSFGHPGTGRIPQNSIQNNNLIGAFDGGFLYNDGQYGMIADGITYAPLKQNTATLIGRTNGELSIVNYSGQDLGNNIAFVRQNCPILIENGNLAVTDPKNKAQWGRTLTSQTYTWRSGIGITSTGNLLYAGGNNLTPATLAYALKTAGAVNAMQLDINPAWVSFNFFTKDHATETLTSIPFMKDAHDRSKQYIHGHSKDFFYLYKK